MKSKLVSFLMVTLFLSSNAVLAEATEGAVKTGGVDNFFAWFLGVGIAAAGVGIAQGNIIARVVEGTARNPSVGQKLFTLMILGLAMVESLFIFTFVSMFMLK